MTCPCGSERDLDECCGPILAGERQAETAEELMRSRYTAYATGNVDYVIESHAPEGRAHVDRKATEEWSKRSEWLGLEIRETHQGEAEDSEGVVEFVARYRVGEEEVDHHEIAQFRKDDGRWCFVDGVEVKPRPFRRKEAKVGPNEPCPCGSGKKYKKCCGRPGAAAAT